MSPPSDYRKFLNTAGELNVRLLPRAVYTSLVNAYRSQDEVIDRVFASFYLSWDLEERLNAQHEREGDPDKAAAAQTVLDSLDDSDWWRIMAVFERELIQHFAEFAESQAELLDPVYDDQEARGWQELPS